MTLETKPYTRAAPYVGELLARAPVSESGSEKPVFTVRLSIDPQMHYLPGDSIAIIPENDPAHSAQVLSLLGTTDESLFRDRSIHHVTGNFLRFALPYARDPGPIQELIECGRITEFTVPAWEVLEMCEGVPAAQCAQHLPPLLPRYYSIASADSPHAVDLLIAHTESKTWRGADVAGLCTDYLFRRVALKDPSVRMYLQRAEHFRLPEEISTDVIMIGPGTGLAPFRAFLHSRKEMPGRNWLFFGAQRRCFDFYYRDELQALVQKGTLKLELAFSRDQEKKIYVQDLLLQRADELWEWIQGGAHLYICGDAKRMARDVEHTLKVIAEAHGADGASFLKELRHTKRLSLDVY